MKKSKQQSPIWPYLVILAFLFVLSLAAPRAWDRRTRREGASPVASLQTAARARTYEAEIAVDDPLPLEAAESIAAEAGGAESISIELEPPPDPDLIVSAAIPPAPEPSIDPPPLEPQDQPLAMSAAEPVAAAQPAPAEVAAQESAPAEPALAPEPESRSAEPAPAEPDPTSVAEPFVEGKVIEQAVEAPRYAWPLPRVLLTQLADLDNEAPHLTWPRRAIELVHEVCRDQSRPAAAGRALERLRGLAEGEASLRTADALEPQAGRARYALTRWLDVWQAAIEVTDLAPEERAAATSPERIRTILADFDELARRQANGAAWRAYLELDSLAAAAEGSGDAVQRRSLARTIIGRLASRRLSVAQRRFLNNSPLAALPEELRGWAAEGVAVPRLLANLEQYEFSGLPSDGRRVAVDARSLNRSAPNAAQRLGERLDLHYHNANVRIAVSGSLLNRMIPQPQRIDAPVRDVVVNVPVRGSSSTFTELSVKLVPDARHIRLGLEARGIVDSNTVSSAGPATFRNAGQSSFLVRKLFVLAPSGLRVWPAIAEAENNYNNLISLRTNFDGVPLVGSLVRSIARNQHDEMRGQVSEEATAKVAVRALEQFDTEAEARVREATRDVQERQLARLRDLGLELVPVAFETTEDRVVGRARLSGAEQLGAHSPRPRAPSDSWFSLQLHQTALNNALVQLDLDGRTFELPQLFAWIGEKLARPDLGQLDELPEDVELTFAAQDAVRLNCRDGCVEVHLAIAELKHEGSRWRDFEVYTTYVPMADGLAPRFTREDTIHLGGRSLRGKLEVKLRAIFSRVLSKNRDLRLLGESVTADARVQDLQITQFDVQDGWIALAYSPQRPARVVRRAE